MTMEQYAGIDVSLEASHVCVVDAQGKILKEVKVASEPEALIAWFAAHGTPMASGQTYGLLSGSGVVMGTSGDEARDEGAEESFAPAARVVHELEEAEVVRQLLLRDAPVRAEPGAQQGPEPLDRVDVHLAKVIPVLVAGVLAAPVTNRFVPVAPGRRAGVDAILVGMDE